MRILLASLVIICGINFVVEAYVSYWQDYRDSNYMQQINDVYDVGNYPKMFAEFYDTNSDDTWNTLVLPEYDENEKIAHADNFQEEDGAARVNGDDDNNDSKDSSDNDNVKEGNDELSLQAILANNGDKHDSGDSDTSEKNAHVDNFNEEEGAAIVNDDDDVDVNNDHEDSSDKDNEKDGNNEQIKIIDDYDRNIEKIIQAILAKDGDEHDSDESDTNDATNSSDYLIGFNHTLLEAIKLEDMYTKQWQVPFKDVEETESTENNETNDVQNIDDIDTKIDIAIIVDANENNSETHDVAGNNNVYSVYKYVTFKNDDDNSIQQTNEDEMDSFQFVTLNDDKQNTLQDQESQQVTGSGNAHDENDSESTEINDGDEYDSDESDTNDATNFNDYLTGLDQSLSEAVNVYTKRLQELFKDLGETESTEKQSSNDILDYIKIQDDLTSLKKNVLQKEESLKNYFLRATDDDQGMDLKRFEDEVNAVSSTLNEIKQRAAELQNMLPELYANRKLRQWERLPTMGK